MTPRRFLLRRRVDPTGVSGIGDVAEGILWSDGTVALRWRSAWPSTTHVDQGMRAVESVHGHGGLTTVKWLDGPDTGPGTERSTRRDVGTAWQRHDDPLAPPLDPPDHGDDFTGGDGR